MFSINISRKDIIFIYIIFRAMITWDVFIYVTIPWIRCKIREWVHDEKIREWVHDEISFVMFLMGYDEHEYI